MAANGNDRVYAVYTANQSVHERVKEDTRLLNIDCRFLDTASGIVSLTDYRSSRFAVGLENANLYISCGIRLTIRVVQLNWPF